MSKPSPTQKTLALLRKNQYQKIAIVERWNPFAKIRQDLFGIIDVLAVKKGVTLGVQCTSDSHVAERVTKLLESDSLVPLLDAGWTVEVHGWQKKNGKWVCRIVNMKERLHEIHH